MTYKRCRTTIVVSKVCIKLEVQEKRLVNETQDLTRNVLSSGLFVVHDTSRGGQDNVTELSGWQQVVSPSLDVANLDVESWGDDTTLVQSTGQLNNNLTGSVVIDVFELTDVAVLLHNLQELDDDLGGWSDQDLTLTGLFSVVDGVQSVSEDGSSGHFCLKLKNQENR
ncbi:40S ribosomal protein S22 [Clavispora lusitaniae ATCC 42720]|uniref:40S ribosomal protein S22 n=1 Tax=Clavispora lusitaniae (strain ATCC 42720) TaxID=306902 RepID=C4Y5X2_CLAL4|nr:40S ribosomal protein S22 [Clavispora lusitaniae ATCC 42720]EEQ39429.1 40S ribosomal protein S22 [Clavispora lusitaniae ATCC 42720]